MKSKPLISAILTVILLCAFIIITTIRFGGHRENAQAGDNTLVLTVSYDSHDEFFEILKHIVVAENSDFTNPLRMNSCLPEDGKYIYEFTMTEPMDTIYIEPPVLYISTEISPISTKLIEGNSAIYSDGTEWFSITSVNTSAASDGRYRVSVYITPNSSDLLPRSPKLAFGEKELGGINSLNFNESGEFDVGTFTFYVSADSIEEASSLINDSLLVVKDASVRVDAKNFTYSSNIKTLSIIEKAVNME